MKTIYTLFSLFIATIIAQSAMAQAPQGLQYRSFTGTAFEASWDACADAVGYEITVGEYDPDTRAMVLPAVASLSTDSPYAMVDGLEAGAFYCFRVRAAYAYGYSEYSAIKAVLELPVPANVTASMNGNILSVNWSEVPGAHYYNIMVTDLHGSHPGLCAMGQTDTYTTDGLSYDIAVNGYGYCSYVVGVSAVACGSDGEAIAQSNYAGASVTTSSISSIEADGSEAEYFDLNGRRVSTPAAGQPVIEIRGASARKIQLH